MTRSCSPLPGLSYALKLNLHRGGLPCDLFLAHAWDEGVYELAARVMAVWPDTVDGAYLCCLSHPQH